MTGILLLTLLALAAASIWPLNRWALRRGATPVGIGIVISLVSLAGGVGGSLVTGQPIYHPAAFFFGALGGVAYGVGYLLLILRCLSVGPAGPTALAYGLGFAGTISASLLVPDAPVPSVAVLSGLGATLLAVMLMGLTGVQRSPATAEPGPGRRDWSRLVVAGWAFCALHGTTQFLSARFAPMSPFGSIVAQYLVSLLLLLVVASSRGTGRPRFPDLVAGVWNGIFSAVLLPASATIMGGMETSAIYPIMAAAPVILVAATGALAYRERLTVWGWAASIAGVAALVLLSLPRG